MPQSYYKFFLGFVAAVAPLATDMYLPAIPQLAEMWGVNVSLVNLSLVLWFVAYSFTLLVWGSLSDRFGRRPILLIGLALFAASSVFCAMSQNVWQLIATRILQGIAGAGGASMVMAIARDRFEGKDRQQVLAWIGVILGLAPMIAPSIGAAIMQYGNWRMIFYAQGLAAALMLAVSLMLYQETAITLYKAGVFGMAARYGRLMGNANYVLTNASTSILSAPLLGFVAFSPLAYIQHFGMSRQQFALLFAVNALALVVGSASCAHLIHRFSDHYLLTVTLVGSLVGGILVLLIGHIAWIWFLLSAAMFTYFFGMSRPLVNHLVLEQVNDDIGAASSAVICSQFLCGAAGMAIATQHWQSPFLVFGALATLCPLATLLLWPWILRRIRTPHTAADILQPEPPPVG
ncbi:multidrug effflux MFS transporter [Aeoliella mucimassa]|uniref:Bicyclomycin resistance protein n=1 Tax=Aeoliella mucimassa TaxID=2527972 RepID=A0A518AJQ9_9BACT|nr:multidrug effflux MFS transporter [Aeoliella mucimassa]QDU54987.1 Bicyclomycin resistance protein [Aeoliella mucimassa]